jgi:uridine kinase
MKRPFVIGIAGGSGSGKSTLVTQLTEGPFGPQISELPHDAYYLNFDGIQKTEDGAGNWDHPKSIENELYQAHVQSLIAGNSVHRPVYDFATHSRSPETVEVTAKPVLLLEGILLFAVEGIRDLIDLRVYVDTPGDLRLLRRTLRDSSERGRTMDDIAKQYQRTVRPMHAEFVEPSRHHAHLWIPWLNHNPVAVETITARIAAAVAQT